QMAKAALEGISAANWLATGGFATTQTTLDVATTLYSTGAYNNPQVDNVSFGYTQYELALHSDIEASATSITLDVASSAFSKLGNTGALTIDNEKIFYNAISKDTTALTATLTGILRGYNDTTAATHSAGVKVSFTETGWRTDTTKSWYAASGGKAFPAKVYLVAGNSGFDIIDASNDSIYLNFAKGIGNAITTRATSVTSAGDGLIFVGTEGGVIKLDFVADTITKYVGQKKYAAANTLNFKDANGGKFYYTDEAPLYANGNLVAAYDMDNFTDGTTLADASGKGKTATVVGDTTFTDNGVSGKAATFDGSGDYLTVGAITSSATIKSVSFWVYPTSTTNYFVDLNGSAYINATSGTIVATGFTSPTIYVNGVVSSTLAANAWQMVTVTTATALNASATYLGKVSTSYLAGKLDSVSFYTTALSAETIADLYQARLASLRYGHTTALAATTTAAFSDYLGVGTTNVEDATKSKSFLQNLQITGDDSLSLAPADEFDFDSLTAAGQAADVSGNAKATTLSGNTIFTAYGVSGRAASFDGDGDYLTITDTTSAVKSVSFWMQADDITTRDLIYLASGKTITLDASSNIVSDFTTPTIYVDGVVAVAIPNTGWHFITVTTATAITVATPLIAKVGATATNYFDGSLDEVTFYGSVLPAAQVTQLYNAGRRAVASADSAAITSVAFDASNNFYYATNSAIYKEGSATLGTLGSFTPDATALTSAIDSAITSVSSLAINSTYLYAGTDTGVEKLALSDLSRSGSDTYLANSGGANNSITGNTNLISALHYFNDGTLSKLAVATNDGIDGNGSLTVFDSLGDNPGLDISYDAATATAAG
ncbi:MAG: hypothetical protein PHO48_05395, partial [Candidatus Gracilibacteria bacterium]|nr:hypothetical protein [Candidatus Gracilibacteria bacterium]